MSPIISKETLSLEYWPNGSKVTACRAWLHADDGEILELDERRLTSLEERTAILAALQPGLDPVIHAELRRSLEDAAIEVLDAQAQAKAAKQAKQGTLAPATEEPTWDGDVNGTELLDEIVAYMKQYLVFPSTAAADAVALWVVFRHVHDAGDFSVLLVITSPTRGSGKSRVLEVIYYLVPKPWKNLSPSDAVLYRRVDRLHPTLLVDEADNTDWRNRPALVAILNGGFAKLGAVVPRCIGEGSNMEEKDFSVWCPKALASKGTKGIPDTTLSRAILVPMQRKLRSEEVKRFRERKAREECVPIRARIAKWAADHFDQLVGAEPITPEVISDRAADAWSPILAIADLAGETWGNRAREAATVLSGAELEAQDLGEKLLVDIHTTLGTAEKIFSADLVSKLGTLEGSAWSDWRGGRGFTAHALSDLLHPFGIAPKLIRIGDQQKRGYESWQFDAVFSRHVPGYAASKCPTVTSDGTQEVRRQLEVSQEERCDTSKTGPKSAAEMTCDGCDTSKAENERLHERKGDCKAIERGDAWEGEGEV